MCDEGGRPKAVFIRTRCEWSCRVGVEGHLNRDVAVLILLVALLAIVLFCLGAESPEADPVAEFDRPAATPKILQADSGKGIAWANWRERKESEVEAPEASIGVQLPASDLPADVAERLARDYKGMDIFVSRGAGHE